MNNDAYAQRVKDVMSRDVVSIHVGETLHGALELMAENRVAALPVVDRRDHCVGMLSTSDIIDVARDVDEDLDQINESSSMVRGWLLQKLGDSLGHEKINGLMTENVASVTPETPLVRAAREMMRHRVHRLPVLDDARRLIGIVSTTDLLGAFANAESDL